MARSGRGGASASIADRMTVVGDDLLPADAGEAGEPDADHEQAPRRLPASRVTPVAEGVRQDVGQEPERLHVGPRDDRAQLRVRPRLRPPGERLPVTRGPEQVLEEELERGAGGATTGRVLEPDDLDVRVPPPRLGDELVRRREVVVDLAGDPPSSSATTRAVTAPRPSRRTTAAAAATMESRRSARGR